MPGVVAFNFNPSTQEAETRRSVSLRPAGLQSKFQDSQGYTEKLCLEKYQKPNQNSLKKARLVSNS